MSGLGEVDLAPERARSRFTLCVSAALLFAVAIVCDIVLAVIRPTCPPGWTSWDLEPGLALVMGVPLSLLLLVSIVATVRARRASPVLRGALPVATLASAVLAVLAVGTVLLFTSSIVAQLASPNAGCTTF